MLPAKWRGRRCAIIADKNTANLFGDDVAAGLAEFQPTLLSVPPGERSKTLSQVEWICEELIKAGLDRSSFLVGLGGGVIGDLSGFVAAVFHRGIPHVQIPTTLLAMVDSAIGGKTGVNLQAGKNLVGAIHHPTRILVDVEALKMLPPAEKRQGFAEIIKHGVIRDAEMLQQLEAEDFDLEELVRRNIALKGRIVAADDREISGERAVLNFGHTIGHAIERATDFQLPHGDAVALGMMAACQISEKRAEFSPEESEKVTALLQKFELPSKLPMGVERRKIDAALAHDKKFVGGQIRFVVTPRLGNALVTTEVTSEDLSEAVEALAG